MPARPALKPYNGNPRHLYRIAAQPVPATEGDVPVDERLEPVLAFERDPVNYIQVPSRGTRWHHLVAATRDAFNAGFKDSRGIPLPRGKGVDIAVSAEQRMRALRVMNTLIKVWRNAASGWYRAITMLRSKCLVRACHLACLKPLNALTMCQPQSSWRQRALATLPVHTRWKARNSLWRWWCCY